MLARNCDFCWLRLLHKLATSSLGSRTMVAHVLDGDHRLIGEGGDEVDLLFGERSHHRSRQRNHTDWRPLTQKRYLSMVRKPAIFSDPNQLYSGSAMQSGR